MSARTTPPVSTNLSPTAKILIARDEWDAKTVKNQKRQIQFGFVTALLGPIAVFLLTLQILQFQKPEDVWVARGLIGGEAAILFFVLVFNFCQIGRSRHKWIAYRVRTEVLRREYFMLQARVGPYLTEDDPGNALQRRLLVIEDHNKDPMELIPLQYPGGKPWRDELEDAGPGKTAPPQPDLLECLRTYVANRIDDQRKWFSDSNDFHAKRDRWLESGAKVALALALVAAALHFYELSTGGHGFKLITVAAIVFPPFGAALTALQSLFEDKRLSRSFQGHADVLTGLANECMKLQEEIERVLPSPNDTKSAHLLIVNEAQEAWPSHTIVSEHSLIGRTWYNLGGDSVTEEQKAAKARYELQLKRLVLRTEEQLAGELRQWWLVVSGSGNFL